MIWPEIKALEYENKHELTLIGDKIAEKVTENNGLIDEHIYELGKNLNYLKLSKIKLIEISPKISNLIHLTQLSISDNLLSIIPKELAQLTKLVYLDLSQNKISEIPSIFSGMSKLRSILMRNNCISKIESFEGLLNLQELFLDYNKIDKLPNNLFDLEELMILSLSNNNIDEISEKISSLTNLKTLNMEDNKINDVTHILGQMTKLKQIQLKNNPLKKVKTQLKKLINDNLYKAILDNLKKSNNNNNTKQRKTKNNISEEDKEDQDENEKCIMIKVDDLLRKVIVYNRTNLPKNQSVFFIVKNVQFSPNSLKMFIKFQEQLHKNECDNRKILTIGTHDLTNVNFPLKYSSRSPDLFKIQMMNLNSAYTGRELYERLIKFADTERKSKKRGCATGVHQYLYLTDIDKPQGVVEDVNGLVISFPPLTNCNHTKITTETTDLLIELIGSKLDKCKVVGEKIIGWLLDNDLSLEEKTLIVEPVRVFEDNSELSPENAEKLLVVFPSHSDFINSNLKVIRD